MPGLRTLLIAALLLPACTSPRSTVPKVRELYREAALREARNPVVVIHGILGSRLVQRSTGRIVWGAFTGDAIDPATPEGVRALAVPLPGEEGAMAYEMDEADVYPAGPLEALELSLLFAVLNVEIYADILRALGVGGYTDPVTVDPNTPRYSEDHFTCFTFFYDWRRDNVENAIALGRFLAEKRGEIEERATQRIEELRAGGSQEELAEADELEEWLARGYRFDVVAHSMGGVLARYFLRYGMQDLPADGSLPEVTWAGAEEIDRLVMVATPNLGAMDSLRNLVRGYSPGPFLPYYHPAVLGTMPAIYQLLPRNGQGLVEDRYGEPLEIDLFDAAVWERNGWGLMAEDSARILEWLLPDVGDPQGRRARAREYLAGALRRARHLHAALDSVPGTPCPAEIRLFAADTLPTLSRTRMSEDEEGRLEPTFRADSLFLPGDSVVARYSAVADLRQGGAHRTWLRTPVPWSSVTFLPDNHLGITKNPLFTDNMLFFLLEQQPPRR